MGAGNTLENNFGESYPMEISAQYPDRSSRLLMLFFVFKPVLLIPHLIALWVLGILSGFVMLIAWFAVVFTGRYPRSLWDFMIGFHRWQYRVSAWMLGLTDKYPPFRLS